MRIVDRTPITFASCPDACDVKRGLTIEAATRGRDVTSQGPGVPTKLGGPESVRVVRDRGRPLSGYRVAARRALRCGQTNAAFSLCVGQGSSTISATTMMASRPSRWRRRGSSGRDSPVDSGESKPRYKQHKRRPKQPCQSPELRRRVDPSHCIGGTVIPFQRRA